MKPLTTLALAAVAWGLYTRLDKGRGRDAARGGSKPHEVQRWEDEGGGLPTGGPGPGVVVAPAATPDPDLVHGDTESAGARHG